MEPDDHATGRWIERDREVYAAPAGTGLARRHIGMTLELTSMRHGCL